MRKPIGAKGIGCNSFGSRQEIKLFKFAQWLRGRVLVDVEIKNRMIFQTKGMPAGL